VCMYVCVCVCAKVYMCECVIMYRYVHAFICVRVYVCAAAAAAGLIGRALTGDVRGLSFQMREKYLQCFMITRANQVITNVTYP